METSDFYGTEKVSRILLKIAPPVMLAQLIQALYNIVDSFFVGKYSETGLTALSIIYPVQLLMIALGVGTGVGINTDMAYYLGIGKKKKAEEVAGTGTPLGLILWIIFAAVCYVTLPAYAGMSTDSPEVIRDVVAYGRIVCLFSIGLFTEGIWSKILQAEGDMRTPMIAQIAGAVVNIILDPLLIFGMLGMPEMGISGAAVATVSGQIVAALIVMKKAWYRPPRRSCSSGYIKRIYQLGIPNIIMQSAYTLYILGLNLILAGFSDQAVTALGLYYKWQTFFFIPLGALQTCIVPVISYNYAAKDIKRCRLVLKDSLIMGECLMFLGTLCFEFLPGQMLAVFSGDSEVIAIGTNGFHYIGISFIFMVTSLIFPVFFQAIGYAVKSSVLTIVRTVLFFVPLGYIFSRFGLQYFWLTFPVTELLTSVIGVGFYRNFLKREQTI